MTLTHTIRPGLLVALRTAVRGGVFYDRKDLPTAKEGQTKWETTKTVTDAEELQLATEVRGRCRTLIEACCSRTSFSLLCTAEREADLDAAILEAAALVAAHNAKARHTHVQVAAVKGRLETGDVQAARAVAADIAALITSMGEGIKQADVKQIRKAANEAAQMLPVLTGPNQKQAGIAIEEARKAARRIVAMVEKKGEKLAVALEDVNIRKISRARMAFLDLSEPDPEAGPGQRLPSMEVRRFAAVGGED